MVVTERLGRKRVLGQTLEKFNLIWSISSLKKINVNPPRNEIL